MASRQRAPIITQELVTANHHPRPQKRLKSVDIKHLGDVTVEIFAGIIVCVKVDEDICAMLYP